MEEKKLVVLCGIAKGNSTIEQCSSEVSVNGKWRVGGIVGVINEQAKVLSCFNTHNITADKTSDGSSTVGGIVGGTNGRC